MSSDKIIQNQESQVQVKYGPEVENFYPFLESLRNDKKVLFITTSNRGEYVEKTYGEKAKSTLLAEHLGYLLKNNSLLFFFLTLDYVSKTVTFSRIWASSS